ncbi:MAG: hypothetical protein GF341_01680 [candidate division Zixibacteria bacterium]|nr:hypothetical protein [candidate division Zixibacteria bacterium]
MTPAKPSSRANSRPSGLITLLYVFAFASGAAALLYQVVWVHSLTLTFGSTTESAGVVIASFMAGLGLGARGYAFLKRRVDNDLKLYGIIEVGIAVTAIAVTLLTQILPGAYADLARTIGSSWQITTVRVVASFVVLLIPSFLIGATFPAICTVLIRSLRSVGRHLGLLYGINTIGAAFGTLLAGLVLIERIGNQSTIVFAAAVNAVIGIAAIRLARQPQRDMAQTPESSTREQVQRGVVPAIVIALALMASGYATMSFEITWMRAAKHIVGNSTYAMSLVLAVFLVGLGLGGILHRITALRYKTESLLTLSLIFSGLLVVFTMWLLTQFLGDLSMAKQFSIYSVEVSFRPWVQRLLLTGSVVTCFLLPCTVVMGMIFPLASSLMVDRITVLGRQIGSAYLFSTVGSIAGMLGGALVAVPVLGIVGSAKLTGLVSLAAGLAVVATQRYRSQSKLIIPGIATAVALGLIVVIPKQLPFYGEREGVPFHSLIFWQEGPHVTTKVIEHDPTGERAMTIDGFMIGTSAGWGDEGSYKQMMLAHLPMALMPTARTSLNIGLGSGTTLATLGRYNSIEALDCVEISSSVVAGARHFDASWVLDDPRTTIYTDDAVHYLRRTDRRYDLIISDGKQNPQFPGNSTILAKEFYDLLLDRLSEDGVFVEWIQIGMPNEAFDILLRTFCETFPHTASYLFPPSTLLLAGGHRPVWEAAAQDRDAPPLPGWAMEQTGPYHFYFREQLLACRASVGTDMLEVLGEGRLNTWDHPHLEFMPYKKWKREEGRDYINHNVSLIVTAGQDQLREVAQAASPDLAPFIQSTALLRAGLVEAMRVQTADPMITYCEHALRVNPADSLARGFMQRANEGYRRLMTPGPMITSE